MDTHRIEVRHASQAVAQRVRDWFAGGKRIKILDGSRSVRVPHPEKRGFDLKIKGAGFRGSSVRFGMRHRQGPRAPIFDFDGRMMEDVASGHANAFVGGASFQQAATEFRISQILSGLGMAVVPCVGYGQVALAEHTSWFSVFEWDRSWSDAVVVPSISLQEYIEANLRMGQLIVDLAVQHDLIGYCWYVSAPDGTFLIKDVHPFRQADPVNMSQLSWVMQVLFALHIRCLACLHYPRVAKLENLPPDLQAYPCRGILPDATAGDHADLRSSIVKRYMLQPPRDFVPGDLLAALRSNRIGSALLDACPPRFDRY